MDHLIQRCFSCSVGGSCGSDSIPGLGTSIYATGVAIKKKKKKKKATKLQHANRVYQYNFKWVAEIN